MHKIFFVFLCLLIVFGNIYSQDKEKLISNQSLLIDAIKEEQIGHKEKAIEILEKLKYEPDCKGVSNYYLSKLYRAGGKIEESFEAIDQSILSEPDNTWYLITKAKMTEDYGKYRETALTYEKLSEIEKDNFSHFDNAAFFYLKSEDFKKALEVLNKAERIFGLIPSLAIKKSYVLTFMKKNKNAIEVLEACCSQFPSNKEVLIELIKSLSEMNNQVQALKYIDKLKKLDPDNEGLNHWLTQEQKGINTQHKTLTEYMQSTETSLDDKIKILFIKLNEFRATADRKGIQSLLPYAENLRKQFTTDPKTIAFIGDIHFQLNDLLNAKFAYVQAIRDGQVPYSVWDNLLFCLIQLNHWKTAVYFSDKCMDLYPNQSFPNYVNVLSKFKLNQLNNILPSIDQLELMVNHNEHKKTEVLILKAKVLFEMKQQDASTAAWRLALDTDKDFLAPLEYSVFMASNASSYPKDYFEKAMLSEYINESFKFIKAAELFYYSKDYSKAKQYIDASMTKGYLESYDSLLLAAKIYNALGESKLAQEFTLKATALHDSESFDHLQQSFLVK